MLLTLAFAVPLLSQVLSLDFYSTYQCQDPYGFFNNNGLINPFNNSVVPANALSNAAADCRILLSHLPSRYARTPNANAPISQSLPFLPQGQVSHGACRLRLIEYMGNMPWGSEITWEPAAHTPGAGPPRDERWILQLWTEIAGLALDVVDNCLENQVDGYAQVLSQWRKMKVVIGPNLDYGGEWAARLSSLKDLMAGSAVSPVADRLWNKGFYEV